MAQIFNYLGAKYSLAVRYFNCFTEPPSALTLQNVEVFKTCLDYWNFFVPDVYSSACVVGVLGLAFRTMDVQDAQARRRKHCKTATAFIGACFYIVNG